MSRFQRTKFILKFFKYKWEPPLRIGMGIRVSSDISPQLVFSYEQPSAYIYQR